ncbi:YcaO-like family protein [Mycobacterium innocens]|uniref:YcaO-like family protein n=1 Tax=Mycobacterium innocens TaxID=2341083 RepID=UPI00142E1C51|nr:MULTISPECIES: YcaO-like family protein [Mycobacterium]
MLLEEQPTEGIACRVYKQLGGDDTLVVPLFLAYASWVDEQTEPLGSELGDTVDYRSLARYSSNSGSAIGGSTEEAAVHVINEAIERDATTLFLAVPDSLHRRGRTGRAGVSRS